MTSPHAFVMPPGALAALRHYMGQAEIDAILAGDGPLTAAEREQLGLALTWWRDQQATAAARVRAIAARLSAQ